MTERSAVSQIVQIGKEATPGTIVPATHRLAALDFESQPMFVFDDFRPAGFKFKTVDAITKEWIAAKMKGQMNYGELIYPLASVLNTPTSAVVADGSGGQVTGATKYQFDPSSSSEDTPLTFSFEQGSAIRAHKWGYGLFTSFGMNHTRDKVDLTGEVIGQNLTDNITLTPALPFTDSLVVPGTANTFDVFLDASSGALGTTKLLRALTGAFEFANRWGVVWPINSALASFAGHVEQAPTVTYKCLVEADAQGMALLTTLRAGTTQFLRIRSLSSLPIYSPSTKTCTTNSTTAITAVNPVFTAADVGKAIVGTNIPVGTTLAAQAGASGTLSAAATDSVAGKTITVGTAINYSATFDLAVKLAGVSAFKDEQGVYAIEFTFQCIHDATWGKALHAEVVNAVASLT